MDNWVVATKISCPCVADSLAGFFVLVIVPAVMIVVAALVQARRSARRPSEHLPAESGSRDADSEDSLCPESAEATGPFG